MILFIFLVILAYLMGSFCSAVIVCKTFSLPDPRTQGSKNPGATNVLRLAGKKYALLVMGADLLKGLVPVLIAKLLGADPTTVGYTALAAVLGHMFPIFFEFKGGKGVATALGALCGLQFILGIVVAATWLLVAIFLRYASLASLVSICLAPLYSLLIIQRLTIFLPLFIMAILILYKHRNNITQLIDGSEPKIKIKPNLMKDIEEIMEEEPTESPTTLEEPVVLLEEKTPVKTKPIEIKTTKTQTVTKKTNATKKRVKKEEPKKPIEE